MAFALISRVPKDLGKTGGKATKVPITLGGLAHIRVAVHNNASLLALHGLMRELILLDRKNQEDCKEKLASCGALDQIATFVQARPEQSFTPDYVDLWNLYHFVTTENVGRIWEFGSGVSTVVIAHALVCGNAEGRLSVLEPSPKWAESTYDALPSILRERCVVAYAQSRPWTVNGAPTRIFAEFPDESPDMIYVDGEPVGSAFRGAENILFLEDRLEPGAAVLIDGRNQAFRLFYSGLSKRRWQICSEGCLVDLDLGDMLHTGQPFGTDLFSNTLARLIA